MVPYYKCETIIYFVCDDHWARIVCQRQHHATWRRWTAHGVDENVCLQMIKTCMQAETLLRVSRPICFDYVVIDAACGWMLCGFAISKCFPSWTTLLEHTHFTHVNVSICFLFACYRLGAPRTSLQKYINHNYSILSTKISHCCRCVAWRCSILQRFIIAHAHTHKLDSMTWKYSGLRIMMFRQVSTQKTLMHDGWHDSGFALWTA